MIFIYYNNNYTIRTFLKARRRGLYTLFSKRILGNFIYIVLIFFSLLYKESNFCLYQLFGRDKIFSTWLLTGRRSIPCNHIFNGNFCWVPLLFGTSKATVFEYFQCRGYICFSVSRNEEGLYILLDNILWKVLVSNCAESFPESFPEYHHAPEKVKIFSGHPVHSIKMHK